MSVRQKKMITFIVVVALLLVFGFALFFDNKKYVSNEQDTPDQKSENRSSQSPSESKSSSDTESTDEEDSSSYQSERLSEEEKKKTQKVAEEFVKRYAAFNAEDPFKNIEDAKGYMTKELYEALKKHPTRGTLTHYKVKPEKTYITDVSNDNPKFVRWNVVMQGKVFDRDGNSRPEEDWYLITLKTISGEIKVSDIRVNAPN